MKYIIEAEKERNAQETAEQREELVRMKKELASQIEQTKNERMQINEKAKADAERREALAKETEQKRDAEVREIKRQLAEQEEIRIAQAPIISS